MSHSLKIHSLDSDDDDMKNSSASDDGTTETSNKSRVRDSTSTMSCPTADTTSINSDEKVEKSDEEGEEDIDMNTNSETEEFDDENDDQKTENIAEERVETDSNSGSLNDIDINTNKKKKSSTNEDSNSNSQKLRRSERQKLKRDSMNKSINRKRNISSIEWNDTLLKNMRVLDIRQLLETREEFQHITKHKKQVMIEHLTDKCQVELEGNLMDYTLKELKMECKLRGINSKADRKDIIIARLKGEIEVPAIKKARPNLKKIRNPVFVVVYTPADTQTMDDVKIDDGDDDGNNNVGKQEMGNGNNMDAVVVDDSCVLGVYRTEWRAYAKGCEQMLADLKLKNMRAWEKAKNALKRQQFADAKGRMDYLVDTVADEFMENKEPYVVVKMSSLLK